MSEAQATVSKILKNVSIGSSLTYKDKSSTVIYDYQISKDDKLIYKIIATYFNAEVKFKNRCVIYKRLPELTEDPLLATYILALYLQAKTEQNSTDETKMSLTTKFIIGFTLLALTYLNTIAVSNAIS